MASTHVPVDTRPQPDVPGRVVSVTINGARCEVPCADSDTLVELLRTRMRLKGTHAGCLNGDCGSCTVSVDGMIVKSCLIMAASVEGREVVTVEGLAKDGQLSRIQESFWEHDGFQCGYCLPGQLFAAADLLEDNPDPSDDEIRHALQGNLCRCTGYQKMVDAIRAVAR